MTHDNELSLVVTRIQICNLIDNNEQTPKLQMKTRDPDSSVMTSSELMDHPEIHNLVVDIQFIIMSNICNL